MAYKTFISYKYSDSLELRDKIIDKLGDDAVYYKGEDKEDHDKNDWSNDRIKEFLKNKIHDTSITIVIISPNMLKSQWIEWEISYSLKCVERGDKVSRRNNIIGIVQEYEGSHDWFIKHKKNKCGKNILSYEEGKVFKLISSNRRNRYPKIYSCDNSCCIDVWTGSYITYVTDTYFLSKIDECLDKTADKKIEDYKIHIN